MNPLLVHGSYLTGEALGLAAQAASTEAFASLMSVFAQDVFETVVPSPLPVTPDAGAATLTRSVLGRRGLTRLGTRFLQRRSPALQSGIDVSRSLLASALTLSTERRTGLTPNQPSAATTNALPFTFSVTPQILEGARDQHDVFTSATLVVRPPITQPDQHDILSAGARQISKPVLATASARALLDQHDISSPVIPVTDTSAEILTGAFVSSAETASSNALALRSLLSAHDPALLHSALQVVIDDLMDIESMQIDSLAGTPEGDRYQMMLLYAQLAKQPLAYALRTLQRFVDQPDLLDSPQNRTEALNALVTLGFQDIMVGILSERFSATEFLAFVSEVVLDRRGRATINSQAQELAAQSLHLLKHGALPSNLILGRQHTGAEQRLRPEEPEDTDTRVNASTEASTAGYTRQ